MGIAQNATSEHRTISESKETGMDHFFHRKAPSAQQPGGPLIRLQQIFKDIINGLVNVFVLTNEDEEKAGIYRGEGRD